MPLLFSDRTPVYRGAMNPPRPNLFDFATSELSQDAFLSWCIAWADSKYAATDPALHALGRDLVSALFRAAGKAVPGGEYTVEVKRQLKRLDVVAEIGETHLLAIEDKVHAMELHNPLKDYIDKIAALYPQRERAFIFLKTGDQASYEGVQADGWIPFKRSQLLEVLRRADGCQNAIYSDFVALIESREAAVQRFKTAPVDEWGPGDAAFVGLFLQLQGLLADGEWRYVANPSGGFLGFWWNFEKIEGGEVYFQLEEKNLVAKIWAERAERRGDLRELWFRRVVEAISGFKRPERFGNGEYMTVAVGGDYRVKGPDGRLDLEATAQALRAATAALSKLVAASSAR